MSGFDSFLGNEQLIRRLKRDVASSRISHAYIIEGAEGSGKRTLARLICAAIACKEDGRPCMECVSCSKILRDQSPDVITVTAEKGKAQLGVDVIRKVREDAAYAPNDLLKKFYIIPFADTMNDASQNALLKILEEPPPHVMFMLLSENADNLLSTIRSRAPILRTQALDDELVREYLIKSDANAKGLSESDPDAFGAAIKLSRGSIGKALELTNSKKSEECLSFYKSAEVYLELLAARRDAQSELKFFEYATKLANAKQRTELSEIYSLLADATRDLVACKLVSEPKTIFYTTAEKARTVADSFALGKLMELVNVFDNAKYTLERNANVTLSQVCTFCDAVAATRTNRR